MSDHDADAQAALALAVALAKAPPAMVAAPPPKAGPRPLTHFPIPAGMFLSPSPQPVRFLGLIPPGHGTIANPSFGVYGRAANC